MVFFHSERIFFIERAKRFSPLSLLYLQLGCVKNRMSARNLRRRHRFVRPSASHITRSYCDEPLCPSEDNQHSEEVSSTECYVDHIVLIHRHVVGSVHKIRALLVAFTV